MGVDQFPSAATAPWFLGDLADEIAAALATLEAQLRLAEAPHGLDEWPELPLQEALATALALRHDVTREVHYPSSAGRKRSHRPRCDLVLQTRRAPTCGPLWLELKIARQRKAGAIRDPRYAAQWQRHLIADLRKLGAEPLIRDAALALIAFTEDEPMLHRDLDTFESLLVRHDVIVGFRQVRVLPVVDRIGNRCCAVALWPTMQPIPPEPA